MTIRHYITIGKLMSAFSVRRQGAGVTNSIDLGKPTCVVIPREKRGAFNALTQLNGIAVPTLALAFVSIGSVLLTDIACVAGMLPLWGGLIANTIAYYWFFSVIHDGVHRAICPNGSLNDFICQLAITAYAPFAAMALFRWAHMEHHRFANDAGDPDDWSHGPIWQLPFRWMLIDFYYGYRAFTTTEPAVRRVLRRSIPNMLLGVAFLGAVVLLGFGKELLMLWLVPSRIAFIGIGYAFFWLPHSHWPDPERSLKQSENFTLATLLRTGSEWLLNPLLQYQNYHLIHHLWPTTPFYNNERVYRLLEEEFAERDLALVTALRIRPNYRLGRPTGGDA
jgi:beta-carotene hydroxylase